MGKSAKTFTIDIKILAWLEEYAKKENKKESHIVNQMLNSLKRQFETWICPECDGTNHISEKVCWATTGCKGVKLDLNMTLEESRKKLRDMGVPESVIE